MITRLGTFQKTFTTPELKVYVAAQLGRRAHAASPGVVLVFSDSAAEEDYLARRQYREWQTEAWLAAYAQLARIVRRAPEVMVKVTGSTRDGGHLMRHLDYLSRNGRLTLEGPDGERLWGRVEMKALAGAWALESALEPGGRKDRPLSRSIVLSMPRGTDAMRLHDAARAFAADAFGERFPYVFALHDEGGHPHVHLTVGALGSDGTRLNPKKADLEETGMLVIHIEGAGARASDVAATQQSDVRTQPNVVLSAGCHRRPAAAVATGHRAMPEASGPTPQ